MMTIAAHPGQTSYCIKTYHRTCFKYFFEKITPPSGRVIYKEMINLSKLYFTKQKTNNNTPKTYLGRYFIRLFPIPKTVLGNGFDEQGR